MGTKSPASVREPIGRVGPRRQVVIPRNLYEDLDLQEGDFVAFARKPDGVLIKPRKAVDPDGVLSKEESAQVKKAEREMGQGKYVTLAELRHDLDRPRSRRSRKTA